LKKKALITLLFALLVSIILPVTLKPEATSKTSKPKASYLMNPSKTYIYKDNFNTVYTYKYAKKFGWKGNQGWNLWNVSESENGKVTNKYTAISKETKNGLYSGLSKSNWLVDLKYPIKKGRTWTRVESDNEFDYTITSVNATVKTPSGTYKNVIKLHSSDSEYTYYFAKGIGLIKETYEQQYVLELQSIRNK